MQTSKHTLLQSPNVSLPAAASRMSQQQRLQTMLAGKPASPLSVFSKILAPGLLTMGLWTHVWFGWPIAAAVFAIGLVTIAGLTQLSAARPGNSSWPSRVCYGERVWLNRLAVPVPHGLNYRITTLFLVYWTACLMAMLGAAMGSLVPALTGLLVAYCCQFVYFRKLLDLFDLMQHKHPLYRFWVTVASNDNKIA